MLRSSISVLRCLAASSLACSLGTAQLTVEPLTGCRDGAAEGGSIFSVGGRAPTVGCTLFALEFVVPPGADAVFVTWGVQNPGPSPVLWPLGDACFAGWTNPPAQCIRTFGAPQPLDGGLVRQGKFVWPFAIPNEPLLVPFTTANPLSFQFVCVSLAAPTQCIEITAGLTMVVLPAAPC